MRIRAVFVTFILCCSLCLSSQDLTYTYPLTFTQFSDDIDTVDLYSGPFGQLDTSKMSSSLELISPLGQRTILENGRILKHITPDQNLEIVYNYDDDGNIVSKHFKSPMTDYKIDFLLCPKELKVEAYQDNILKEVSLFDDLCRRISRIVYVDFAKYSSVKR